MYGFRPTITSDDQQLMIVGYVVNTYSRNNVYKIPVATIIASIDHQHNRSTPTKWTKLTPTNHYDTALVLSSSPPVVVGGQIGITGGQIGIDQGSIPTEDIKIYDHSKMSWKKIESLSSARSHVAVAAVYNNAIIIIGGCTKADTAVNAKLSCVTVVELGQAELLH